jgi:Tfp pilus assembly protein PilP
MSGAKASPTGRSHRGMSGTNASPIGRSHRGMSGRHLSILAIALLALSGCGGEEAPKAAATTPAPKAPAKAPANAQVEEESAPVLSVPEGFRYDQRGRRDPFVNPIPKPAATQKEEEKLPPRPDGLPGVLVAEAKIAGIVTSKEPGMNKAIINAPGRRTYFAVRGETLYDGVIKEIRPDAVVFTMISPVTKRPVDREFVVKTGSSAGTTAGEKK